ncbi:hypothetical protein BDV59DRAFT_14248 [Aspergillus ambiguus]|uniref:putative cytokinesis regulator (Byr4) n=1 Tax=Aspergillus ambiguus TaxID=176160 RepID=UPI003CCCF792
MEPFTLQVRHDDEETIECWDDDDDLQCYGDIQLRAASTATSVTNSSVRRSGHRDSISSRRSARSDLDSNVGTDEDWQVQLLDNDDAVNEEAITSARNAGIPLPANVPKSALVGGTIKRLGQRKPKKEFIDDWSEEVEPPGPDSVLELKTPQATCFPESLRQVNSTATSPVKTSAPQFGSDSPPIPLQSPLTELDSLRDVDVVADFEDVPTIKVAKPRSPQRASVADNPKRGIENNAVEDFEDDFEFPDNDDFLRLSPLKVNARNSSPTPDEFDVDWSEGSIGVRFGGTTRDRRSNPSSSVTAVSPSASSCLTGESEDEGLDGLVIPEGPLDLESPLRKRKEPSQLTPAKEIGAEQQPRDTDDFFFGLEIDNGDAFDSRRLSINPNVKRKTERPGSPTRRSATTLTFTNATISPKTRIPRPSGHDRLQSTHLETVSESGAPLSRFRDSLPGTNAHSSNPSVSSLPAVGSAPMSSSSPNTNRTLGTRLSKDSTSGEGAGGGRLPLRTKRSMPTMRNTSQLPSFQTSLQTNRPSISTIRPKTPVDRLGIDTRQGNRRIQPPFIPAGASENQSHHARVKTYRHSRRTHSDTLNDSFGSHVSRSSRSSRSDIFDSNPNESSPENLLAGGKRTLTRPTRRRHFGDGSELASFDDLPTSSSVESRFVKPPSGRGAPKSLRNKLSRSQTIPSGNETVPPSIQSIPPRSHDTIPRFARDTNASRIAREQRIASMTSSSKNRDDNTLTSLNSKWRSQTISRVPSSSPSIRTKKNRTRSGSGNKPHLIKPLGTGVQEAKSLNGMQYNPATFCWEGNEISVRDFEMSSPRSPKPAPALITKVGTMQNVQVVGDMVFDPRRMCWLRLAPSQSGADGVVAVQDEDDVFAGLDDLDETAKEVSRLNHGSSEDIGATASGDDRSCGDSSDEWPITEEFDVGPEFVRRQRAEEDKWRRKVDKWTKVDRERLGDGWRWAIRDLVRFNSGAGNGDR